MGVWVEQVVPRIANRALDNERVRAIRARTCAGLRGEVLEIGFGSGLNVPLPGHGAERRRRRALRCGLAAGATAARGRSGACAALRPGRAVPALLG